MYSINKLNNYLLYINRNSIFKVIHDKVNDEGCSVLVIDLLFTLVQTSLKIGHLIRLTSEFGGRSVDKRAWLSVA